MKLSDLLVVLLFLYHYADLAEVQDDEDWKEKPEKRRDSCFDASDLGNEVQEPVVGVLELPSGEGEDELDLKVGRGLVGVVVHVAVGIQVLDWPPFDLKCMSKELNLQCSQSCHRIRLLSQGLASCLSAR